MNNSNTFGGTISHVFGALSETVGAVHDLASVTRGTVQMGHVLNSIGERNLHSWDRISKIQNEIKYQSELRELKQLAEESGIDISSLDI